MRSDGVNDVSQAGEPEAHARGDGDLAAGGLEMQSTQSAEEDAEMIRLLGGGQEASVDEEKGMQRPASFSAAHAVEETTTEVGAGQVSMSEPGWMVLPEADE
ncbi:hypothetical protein NM688_g9127 [Phlebia brevispora]|uniref:Uncharacterized protein n=1 Tax=Phlebia brevispora TaxID=194682 RepID=A0ACC1RJ49_9APHY|nr:hypothetical protein NM688_g9127 [Phlebia brevispora]